MTSKCEPRCPGEILLCHNTRHAINTVRLFLPVTVWFLRYNLLLTGISTDHASPPSLQFSCMAILETGDMMPRGFEISLFVIHCDGTGLSTQHCFLIASYKSFLLVGSIQTTICSWGLTWDLIASKNADVELFCSATLKN